MIALDMVTRTGHDVVMKQVRIADLKAHLSEYLHRARDGETITVCDRDTPVALLVPVPSKPPRLKTRPPLPGSGKWYEVKVDPLPPEVVDRIMRDFFEEREKGR